MSRRQTITLAVIIAIVAFSVAALVTNMGGREGLVLGLDLRGGTNLVYEADFTDIEEGREADSLRGAKDIIERRINAYGVSEPVIQIVGSNRILIQLPGVTDIEEAKDLVGKSGGGGGRHQYHRGRCRRFPHRRRVRYRHGEFH